MRADRAHRETDEKILEMERKLRKIYLRTERELSEKWKEFSEAFAAEDAVKRKLLDDGKITADEYKRWKLNKVLTDERFRSLKEQTVDALANADKIAVAYINGEVPSIYANNYNFTGKQIEKAAAGLGYEFTMTDEDTVRRLVTGNKLLLPKATVDIPKDKRWNRAHVNSELLQSILQGETISDLAKRLRTVTGMDFNASVRNARTMATAAENAGRADGSKRAQEDGVILKNKWIATDDDRTRSSHRSVNGETVDPGKKFSNGLRYPGDPAGSPEEVYNCRCTMKQVVEGFRKK